MKLYWTKSSLPLSLVIRAVTGEDCSHFLVVFDKFYGGLMFQSNLLGCAPGFFKNDKVTIVHEREINLTKEQEEACWKAMVDKYDGHGYDFLGAIYLGWRKLLYRWFKIPIPEINKWGSQEDYFCDELYLILSEAGIDVGMVGNGMQSPHDVWETTNGAVH